MNCKEIYRYIQEKFDYFTDQQQNALVSMYRCKFRQNLEQLLRRRRVYIVSNCAKYMTTIRREFSNLIFYYSIVFNDSLGNYHDKNKYAKIVRDWLNSEWIQVGVGDIFGQQKPYTDDLISVCLH